MMGFGEFSLWCRAVAVVVGAAFSVVDLLALYKGDHAKAAAYLAFAVLIKVGPP